jgi:flagellin-like hook-associated protein FlgL
LSQTIIGLLNTTFSERYVFGGDKDNAPPFDSNGNYVGDPGVRTVEVAPGQFQAASLDANAIVKGGGNGVDLLQSLSDLQTALQNNDGAGIRTEVGNLTTGIKQLAAGRAQAGIEQDAFQNAVSTAQAAASGETVQVGKLLDADIIGASTQLASAQYALNATLTAAAKTFSMSLADKLP